MIVFKGELSEKNKKILRKETSRFSFIPTLIVSVILIVPITLAVVYYDTIIAYAYIIIPVLLLATLVPVSKKDWKLVCPIEISIDDVNVIINGEDWYEVREISNLESIVDLGDCYRMFFEIPEKTIHCLCQKDLIVEGTIEEFEERFAEFIVRKA